jgi:hypothetical protein
LNGAGFKKSLLLHGRRRRLRSDIASPMRLPATLLPTHKKEKFLVRDLTYLLCPILRNYL